MRVWCSNQGAVAPIVGLSLFGLVAAAGIAFDYARMVALDTELQNAADQAALAAATQLDDGSDACVRASAAAVTFISNLTILANDGGNRSVTIPSEPFCDATGNIRFYQDQAKTIPALSGAQAHFVEVTVNARQANFALTPIVASFTSGNMVATAFAGMGSAICGAEPLMICNPDEPNGNSDLEYPFAIGSRIGIGIELVDDEQDVPGNFGFLESGLGGASGLLKTLAYDSPPGNCLALPGVETKPGFNASVMDGLNTRFDIKASNDCPAGGTCSSSLNARKDLVRPNACNWSEPAATAADQATATPPRYRPTDGTNPLDPSITPVIMGHPRDICHATGENADCGLGNRLGNGVWDRAAYFRSNHPGLDWVSEPGLGPTVTRWQTYLWELEDVANRLEPKDSLTDSPTKTAYGSTDGNKCHGPGLGPQAVVGSDGVTRYVDRRLLRAAVLNCKAIGVHGRTTKAPVLKWLALFLVEPALNRFRCDDNDDASGCKTKYTDKREVYVELVGEEDVPDFGDTGPPIFRRDVPYLIE